MSFTIQLKILPDPFSVHQYDRDFRLSPTVLQDAPWYTVSKTTRELSLIVPSQFTLDAEPNKTEAGWRMFQVDAQMDFGLVGILARIVSPLKDHGIPVFVVSTFDTDYVMVKEDTLAKASEVLDGQEDISVTRGNSVFL
jgi:hypothetical protein